MITVLVVAFLADSVNLLFKVLALELPVEDSRGRKLLSGNRDRRRKLMRLSAIGVEVVVKVGAHCGRWMSERERKERGEKVDVNGSETKEM